MKEIKKYGECSTRLLVLEAYDRFAPTQIMLPLGLHYGIAEHDQQRVGSHCLTSDIDGMAKAEALGLLDHLNPMQVDVRQKSGQYFIQPQLPVQRQAAGQI